MDAKLGVINDTEKQKLEAFSRCGVGEDKLDRAENE